mgnify:CR=1 FL=1
MSKLVKQLIEQYISSTEQMDEVMKKIASSTKKYEKNNFQNIIYEVKNSQLVNKLGYTAYGSAGTLYSQHYIIITQDSVVEILVSANSDLSISQY